MVADYLFDMKWYLTLVSGREVYGFFAILLQDQNIKLITLFTATLAI